MFVIILGHFYMQPWMWPSYEVDSDLKRWIVDIIHLKWSNMIGQIH